MIFVIMGVSVGVIALGLMLYWALDIEWGEYLAAFGILATIVAFIAAIIVGVSVSELRVIDEKIIMYEEQNAKIEAQIATAIEQYQEYESGIYCEVANGSAMAMISLYPELKADALVASQIELYIKNNSAITALKEEAINGPVYRWWLYFGR